MSIDRQRIQGNVGSRVRLILGDNGNEWLLLLNHDDGFRKWQEKDWRCIPAPVARQLNNCTSKNRYIKDVDFGPNGSWYVYGVKRDGTGGHSWWGGTFEDYINYNADEIKVSIGKSSDYDYDYTDKDSHFILNGRNGFEHNGIDDNLFKRVKRINNRNKSIHFVRLFNGGGYFVSDDEGTQWNSVGVHCAKEIKKGGKVEEVAVAKDGSWVIIFHNRWVCSVGVDKELEKKLSEFFRVQARRKNEADREVTARESGIAKRAREEGEREARELAERHRQEREAREHAERERQEREAAERERSNWLAERHRQEREREAREHAERERQERETAERERIDRLAEQHRQEREAREHAERERQQRETAERERIDRHFSIASEAIEDITHLADQLQKRKADLKESLNILPPATRSRLNSDIFASNSERHLPSQSLCETCVVCYDEPCSMAVVPCGHFCLCVDCAAMITGGAMQSQNCPICRERMQGTMKIFMSTRN